jgi:hypothetical protein
MPMLGGHGELIPIVGALGLVLGAGRIGAQALLTIRQRSYAKYERLNEQEIANRYPINIDESPSAYRRFLVLTDLSADGRQVAVTAQSDYHAATIQVVIYLFSGYVAAVLAATIFRWSENVEAFLLWVEVVALAAVLFQYHKAHTAMSTWIRLRTIAELQRQYRYLQVIRRKPNGAAYGYDITSEFERDSERIRAEVVAHSALPDIAARIKSFWLERRTSLEKTPSTAFDLSSPALKFYISGRVLGQLRWFMDSRMRLQAQDSRRKGVLALLYSAAFAFAAVKAAAHIALEKGFLSPQFAEITSEWLLCGLLVLTGISAAMTAYYFSHGSRSLIHRYTTQEQRIKGWLEAIEFEDGLFSKIVAVAHILQFENLVIEELVDWIAVSGHDVLELAP